MKEKLINKLINYLPIILIEVYLISTLLLFKYGPFKWKIENEKLFWVYISAYHIFFIIGYIVYIKVFFRTKRTIKKNNKFNNIIKKHISIIFVLSSILLLIKYMGFFNTNNFIPIDLPKSFINGLIDPGSQYRIKFISSEISGYQGNKILSSILALFSFIVSSVIPLMVYFWDNLKKSQKVIFFILIFFDFAMFVSGGTNKGIFDILFILSTSLLLNRIANYKTETFNSFIKGKKVLIGMFLFLLIFSMYFFALSMKTRVGSIADYTESLSNDITIVENILDSSTDKQGSKVNDTLLNNLFYGLSSYVCQGYYGMSLAIDEDFTSTYGIGNSQFLLTNFKYFFGIDYQKYTFQYKVSDKWDQFAQWHSFYSYIANDVSFPGVIFIMFILGLSLASIYLSAIYYNNVVAHSLLTLYAILFLYLPANNQVFSMMQSFSTFFELLILWMFSKRFEY